MRGDLEWEVQVVTGCRVAEAERGRRGGVKDTKFWSQCFVFVLLHRGVGPNDEKFAN